MKKAPEAFRTISEVAELLATPAHVLRFWESKFYQIRPVKRAGGRRYYRPDDVALINGIRTLLQDKGMTIRGAQRILQEQGVKAVAQMGLPLPHGGALLRVVSDADAVIEDDLPADLPADEGAFDEDLADAAPPRAEVAPAPAAPPVPAAPEPQKSVDTQPLPEYALIQAMVEPEPAQGPDMAAETGSKGGTMSDEDLLAPLSEALPDAPARREPSLPLAPAPAPVPEPQERPLPAQIARALRLLPRQGPASQRDRLIPVARRIDALLDRMSEASGAGRW